MLGHIQRCSLLQTKGGIGSSRNRNALCHTRHSVCRASAWSELIEGEWSGTSAAFDSKGVPQPLPPSHVPHEYSQWGIELKDWATLTSMHGPEPSTLSLQTRFMLPTVGCEADATSFVEDKRMYQLSPASATNEPELLDGGTQVNTRAETGPEAGVLALSKGHFVAGPPKLPLSGRIVFDASALVKRGERVRVRVHMQKWSADGKTPWKASKVEVFQEAYAGPFKGGRELPMSCGPECGFSGDTPLSEVTAAALAAEIGGVKDGADMVRLPCNAAIGWVLAADSITVNVAVVRPAEDTKGEGGDDELEGLAAGSAALLTISYGAEGCSAAEVRMVDVKQG